MACSWNWDVISSVATAGATIFSGVGLILVGFQMRQTAKVNRSQLMLELRQMFAAFNEVHIKLRPEGDWSGGNGKGPCSVEEWAEVDAYLGLFEHCERMLADNLLQEDEFRRTYGYRLRNLMENQKIVREKLQSGEKGEWADFIELLNRLNISYESPSGT